VCALTGPVWGEMMAGMVVVVVVEERGARCAGWRTGDTTGMGHKRGIMIVAEDSKTPI